LSTRRPYRSSRDNPLMREGPPPQPPSHRNPEVPPALDKLVMKAIDLDPAKRFATAAELRASLQELQRTAGIADAGDVGAQIREVFGEDLKEEEAEDERLMV